MGATRWSFVLGQPQSFTRRGSSPFKNTPGSRKESPEYGQLPTYTTIVVVFIVWKSKASF